MGGLAKRTTAEPHGTPRNTQKGRLRPQIRLFLRGPLFAYRGPIPSVSVVSKRLPFGGIWGDWGNGRTGATDNIGTPKERAKGPATPSIPPIFTRFAAFSLPPSLSLPIPNVAVVSKRLVLVGWSNIGAMRRTMGIWAQRTAAAPPGETEQRRYCLQMILTTPLAQR